jgi:putative colanic acid biosynthesis acetyltransferase WcaF
MPPEILYAKNRSRFGRGASFALSNRLTRLIWKITWAVLARWNPGSFSPWRVLLLNLFGAKVSRDAAVAASARIWLPSHLEIGPYSTIGPNVDCYNMAPIKIGSRTIISQGAFLCAGSHDIHDPSFQLVARPINVGHNVWIAAEAFVAPGVTLGDGCVLSARACAFTDLLPWTVYRGNPAVAIRPRLLSTG